MCVTCSSMLGMAGGSAVCWWAWYDGGASATAFEVMASWAGSMPSMIAADRLAGDAGRWVGLGASASSWLVEWDMSSARFS